MKASSSGPPARRAFFRAVAVSVPVLGLQALLLALGGEVSWALLPVAVILLVATAYAVVVHASGSRPFTAAVPVLFSAASCLVMALVFGPQPGFHLLLVALLPAVLAWERAGEAGRWVAAAALCLLVPWIEFGGGQALLPQGASRGLDADLFRTVNLVASLVLLAAFIRIFSGAGAPGEAPPEDARAWAEAGRPERRRPGDAAARPHLHFLEPDRVFAVIAVEIDHHAAIAGIFGGEVAEEVARQTSALAIGTLRETDMISRRGGHALLIFLPETVEEEAYAVGERVRAAIAALPLSAGDLTLKVTVTLGIARSASSADVTAAIAEAERAAQAGRAVGGDRIMLAGLL